MNACMPKGGLRVLFLCTGNSCRSQMAEGWARALLAERVEAYSAGTEPRRVNPRAIGVMAEVGVNISTHRSKHLDEFLGERFHLVITLCDNAQARCPMFPGAVKMIHMGFADPALAAGSEEDVLRVFRDVRDQIRQRLIPLLEEELALHASLHKKDTVNGN